MIVNPYNTTEYKNKSNWTLGENKPNSNPIKPNSQKAKMNVNPYNTTDYENKSNWTIGQNKPNSNPIKPNLRKAKMNINSLITKDYRKKDDFTVRINKPNFRNGQNERKLNFNNGLQKKRLFSSQKNKPNSNPISPKGQNELKIACQKIWPHPALDIFESFLDASRPNC